MKTILLLALSQRRVDLAQEYDHHTLGVLLRLHVLSLSFLAAFASWAVTYPEHVQGVTASCVLIPCTFSYPSDVAATGGITAIWYKDYASQRSVVYHSATPSEVDARFQDRAELLGDPLAHNCSLLLRSVTTGDSGVYNFRFEISERNRWLDQRGVQVAVTGKWPRASEGTETRGSQLGLQCCLRDTLGRCTMHQCKHTKTLLILIN